MGASVYSVIHGNTSIFHCPVQGPQSPLGLFFVMIIFYFFLPDLHVPKHIRIQIKVNKTLVTGDPPVSVAHYSNAYIVNDPLSREISKAPILRLVIAFQSTNLEKRREVVSVSVDIVNWPQE